MTELLDLALKELGADEIVWGGGKVNDKNPSKSKKSKNVKSRIQTRIKATEELTLLIPSAKVAFH